MNRAHKSRGLKAEQVTSGQYESTLRLFTNDIEYVKHK
jgi:hypothetical protein